MPFKCVKGFTMEGQELCKPQMCHVFCTGKRFAGVIGSAPGIVKVNSPIGKIDHAESPVTNEWEGNEILFESKQVLFYFPLQVPMQNFQPFNWPNPLRVFL